MSELHRLIIEDVPLKMGEANRLEEDCAEFSPLAANIAQLITDIGKARLDFSVMAICAPWGSGKTTFLRAMIHDLVEQG